MNKKRKNKGIAYVTIISTLSILFSVPVSADTSETTTTNQGAILLEKMCEEYEVTAPEEENLITEEQLEKYAQFDSICNYFDSKAADGYLYPDYIGGVYYDQDTQCIIINTTQDDITALQSELAANIENIDDVTIKKVTYSYRTLKDQLQIIKKKCDMLLTNEKTEIVDLLKRLQNISINEQENCLIVYINDLSAKDEALFKTTISHWDNLIFANSETTPCKTNLKPGMRVYACFNNTSSNPTLYKYSIGCRAWRISSSGAYEYGFITAGHGNSINSRFYITNNVSDDNYIGKVTARKCEADVDASFVCVNTTNYHLSNIVHYVSEITLKSRGYVYDDFEGMTCLAVGASSGTFLMGRVSKESVTIPYGDNQEGIELIQNHSDFLELKLNSQIQGGDSGGLAFTLIDGDYYVLGILCAHSTAPNSTLAYACKYANILDTLNVNIY